MANKRQFKDAIRRACGDIATVCFCEMDAQGGKNEDKWVEVVIDAALLQDSAVRMVNPSFGKKVKEFESPAAYRKAKRAFFKANQVAVAEYIKNHVEEFTKRINELRKD